MTTFRSKSYIPPSSRPGWRTLPVEDAGPQQMRLSDGARPALLFLACAFAVVVWWLI